MKRIRSCATDQNIIMAGVIRNRERGEKYFYETLYTSDAPRLQA